MNNLAQASQNQSITLQNGTPMT